MPHESVRWVNNENLRCNFDISNGPVKIHKKSKTMSFFLWQENQSDAYRGTYIYLQVASEDWRLINR